jgi:hypothetical protein
MRENHLEELGTDRRINIKMDIKETGRGGVDWIDTSTVFL